MFENVDGRTPDAGVIGILIAHLGAFGSGELKKNSTQNTETLYSAKIGSPQELSQYLAYKVLIC